ncbi:hypothetical protein AAFF_G00217750 [Aldrovandia affinis]|uniref:Androglobin n=1 Tax=Aldrovandia affinis TaxID=143900 RepID=A0AAD7SXM8_9TELE|nr:hypothetical protein AAFF_G00217750 [Aldrovandia affinis]
MWAVVESNAEKHAVSLLRYIFSNSERSAKLYPCHGDESTRVPFADYSVTFPEQTSNSWFLVFREVFLVPSDMLVVPKVYSPVPACLLHVINNDTGKEVPMIFQRVEPHVYKQNQGGYTFVAEARSRDAPVPGGRWRIRLIGSRDGLPVLSREAPLSNFSVKEFRDYYIPNDKDLICRFSVRVTADHVSTIQIQTSKPDVYIRLAVLDRESEVASSTGKGCAVIPVFRFSSSSDMPPDRVREAGPERLRRQSGRGQIDRRPQGGGAEGSTSQQPAEILSHKYVIQARVLHKSWALDDSQKAFALALKDAGQERHKRYADPSAAATFPRSFRSHAPAAGFALPSEMSVEKQEDPVRPVSVDTQSTDSQKSATPKSNRKAKEREKEKSAAKLGSRPETQSLDASKPQWTLRVVCDQSDADWAEVRKDTERADEIRAMQRAWEAAEPGRAIKATQARLQFINKHLRGASSDEPVDGEEPEVTVAAEEGVDTAAQPPGPDVPSSPVAQTDQPRPAIHIPMDFTPFIRKCKAEPSLKDDSMAEEQRREKAEKIQGFRLIRDTILEHRKQELLSRTELKKQQLELYEGLQVALDQRRRSILQAREVYWQRLLEAELRKEEAESVREAARQAELEKNTPQSQVTNRKQPKSAGKKK